jgi:DNA-binding transcriptional MerR regulator
VTGHEGSVIVGTERQVEAMIRVGEMARRAGVSPRTIKYYEERGLIQPSRSQSDYRLYGQADVERLERICQLRGFGLSIATIEEVLRHPAQRDGDGTQRLSLSATEMVYQSLSEQRDALLTRIEQGRRELAEVETVARELENDLGYLRGRLEARRAETGRAKGSKVDATVDAMALCGAGSQS